MTLQAPALRRVLALALLPGLAACSALDSTVARAEKPVSSIAIGQAADVTAMNLAQSMLRAGFTPEEILELGPAVREALATAGGAQVKQDRHVSAIFSVQEERLYVTSRTHGTFVQPAT